MKPRDLSPHAELYPCACGFPHPVQGWMAPPLVHYVHCPACGDWQQADSEDAARIGWNRHAARARKVA